MAAGRCVKNHILHVGFTQDQTLADAGWQFWKKIKIK
jgi:hypothetical protein